ncbi:MAG: hypothetical protein LC714_03120, partial [Actinobacteria bacterium]|nr:hypothetical protein [Actinomycetota bacterium]
LTLIPLTWASALMLAVILGVVIGSWTAPLIALAVLLAGGARLLELRRRGGASPEAPAEPPPPLAGGMPYAPLLAVLVLVLLRGYLGPMRYDWPFIRGVDQFEHAVMTDMTLSDGSTESFMLYPPGFHYLTAAISRLSGLEPLEIFPVLAPALLVLPPLALYALGRRLWGWEYGVAAALFAGLIANSTYMQFVEARYPNLVTAQFLLVLAVGALFGLYGSSSPRAGLLLALVGSSVVLYHQVASLYEAALLGLVGLCFVPYLLVRERERGVALFLWLGLLGLLSVVFAWDTYDLPRAVAGLVGGSEAGRAGDAVAMALGTQPPLGFEHLLAITSHPVLWLGFLGAFLLMAGPSGASVQYTLARATLLLWGLLLFVGSLTSASGFPERFERDLSMPLALLAAFALLAVLRSLERRALAAGLATLLIGTLVGVQAIKNLEVGSGPTSQVPPLLITRSSQVMLTPGVEAAGEWLEEHNTGGNIVASPYFGLVPSRAMLAMGGYTGLQSYDLPRILIARDLPPSGPEPLLEALWILQHPEHEGTPLLLEKHDIRYVVLYKSFPPAYGVDFRPFLSHPRLYETVFENESVVILAPREHP